MTKREVYIGIGSNLQDPVAQVQKACAALNLMPDSKLITVSSLYSSDSLLEGQPQYINAVACVETTLSADDLLVTLQQIEQEHGRERKERWGARTLDLDIILYGDEAIESDRLTIPHAQMALREFVLLPLLEIAPDICLPDGQRVASLLKNCPSQNIKKLSL